MTDNSKKVSELPTAANVAITDRVMILRDPAGSPSVRTITVNNFFATSIKGPYDSDATANTAGVPLKGLYYNASGTVKIRLT